MNRPLTREIFRFYDRCRALQFRCGLGKATAIAAVLVNVCTSSLLAQSTVAIPVRTVRVVAHSDSASVHNVSSVRGLPDGRVIVNDVSYRRLVVFDPALANATRIADTTTQLPYTYGLKPKPSALIPWTADSTLFVDSDASAILVINPLGVVVNVVGAVRIADLPTIVGGAYGFPGNDAHGRLLYGTPTPFDAYVKLPAVGGPPLTATYPDSNPIVRADFEHRTIDTIAMLLAPVKKVVLSRQLSGSVTTSIAINPLPSSDDWTALPDGTIAIVRAKDYHIDWISPDGTRTSSPSMPFDWRSISPAEKKQMVDSVKRDMEEARAKQFAAGNAAATAGTTSLNVTVDASDIPDSYPPVRPNTTRADMDGRVWLLPATSATARNGLLYDVVNRAGKIVERVQLPPDRALVGFGKGGVVYLSNVFAPNKVILERTEIVR